MALKVRLDHGGMREVLAGGKVASTIDSLAADIASRIDAHSHDGPIEVRVGSFTTDRAAAGVTLAHPAGLAVEAKYGYLAEAAGAVGLEVRSR